MDLPADHADHAETEFFTADCADDTDGKTNQEVLTLICGGASIRETSVFSSSVSSAQSAVKKFRVICVICGQIRNPLLLPFV